MIAPAMNTRPDERLPFRDLARQGARVARSLPADSLGRLSEVAPGRGTLEVDMTFSLDAEARPWVRGSATLRVAATCQRCLGVFDRDLQVSFELCIVTDPALASAMAEEADVLVTDADWVTVADVVEDELLLALPERLCTEEPCPNAPALDYPDADAPEPDREDNPFQVLSQLKR